jgi:hypothetical protein
VDPFDDDPQSHAGTTLLSGAGGPDHADDAPRPLDEQDPGEHPDFAELKAALYSQLDPRFREYFENHPKAIIRLDEIRWGGVRRESGVFCRSEAFYQRPPAANRAT